MSNKLTEEKIEKIIEELLSERKVDVRTNKGKDRDEDDVYLDVYGQNNKPVGYPNYKRLKQIAAQDDNDNELIDKDYDLAKAKAKKARNKKLYGFKAKQFDQFKDDFKKKTHGAKVTDKDLEAPDEVGDIKDIDMDKQVYQPDSMAFGAMANIGSQSSVGQFPEGVSAAVKKLFDGTSTFKDRIDKLSKFSSNIFKNTDLNNADANEILAATLIMDYLTTIVREMDSGSGAYMFETLCATLAGGTVAGKGDVDTTGAKQTGIMGAVDFTFPTSTGTGLGSSKYYTNVGSTNITQALSGFENKAGKTILYIVAHKKADLASNKLANTGTSGATAEPTKILAINIHMISVMPKVDRPTKGSDFKVQVNGGNEKNGVLSDGRLAVTADVANSTPILLQLAAGGVKTFKQAFADATNSQIANFDDIKKYLQDMLKEFYTANQKSQRYISSGVAADGDAALASYDSLGDAQNNLFANLSGTKTAQQIKTSRTLEESKLQTLDDLIAETIRGIKKNKKIT